MIKKLAIILAAVITITGFGAAFATDNIYAASEPPAVQAEAAILIDGNSGEVLYTKNEHGLLEPANTTKIVTCLLALENLEMSQVLTGDEDTAFVDGSKIFLLEGECMTVEQVLNALMTVSANDAAIAIAKAVGGDIDTFAGMMTERAKELGALNTTFKNPNGLHAEGHLTTAYDLAMIAKGCLENAEFRKLCSTYKYYVPATNMQEERYFYNTNRLIYDTVNTVQVNGVKRACYYEDAIGVKTGTTPEAGACLVAAAERDDTLLIAVVLKSTDMGRYSDCISLFDYGFDNYYGIKAADKDTEKLGKAPVKHGAVKDVNIELAESIYVTLPKEASKNVIKTELELYDAQRAPITTGQALGVFNVYEGDNLIATASAVAVNSVEDGTFLSVFGITNKTAYIIFWTVGILTVLIVGLSTTYIVLKSRQIRRRKARRAAKALEIARARAEREKDLNKRDWRF